MDNSVRIRLMKGLTPTFGGPQLEYVIDVDGTLDEATVRYEKYPLGKINPQPIEIKETTIKGDQLTQLLVNAESLHSLPCQPEPHNDDAFGHDIAIFAQLPGRAPWMNGRGQGCAVNNDWDEESIQDSFRVNSEEQDKFKQIADHIHQTAQQVLSTDS
ncbi:hypothetical protein H4R33_006326 [Dimargaris cristalligena]|nr:hypothetical protein H4R33_006326 [Dimargaris cristalligena]